MGKEEHEEGKKGERSYFSERRFGQFQRSFTLPEGIDASHVTANYNNGVLDISIPKSKESKRSKIAISEGSSPRIIEASSSQKEPAKGAERH